MEIEIRVTATPGLASHMGYRRQLTENAADMIRGFLDGLKPTPRINVSTWSNKYRWLSNIGSARPGLYDIDLTPYLKEIVDNLSELSAISEVVFKKGAQIGATEVGNNWLGYIIHIAPAATLMVMPTDDTVKRNSKIRIDPMIKASPVLVKRVKPARSRDSDNTINQKSFPGGVLIMTGANSPAALRSMPIKNVMLDEVDGYPADVGGEGSAVELAKARTNTYTAKRKIFIISTPTVEGLSEISDQFKDSDQRYYHIPCPHCSAEQVIEWENIVWEKGKPETAKLKCVHCSELIEEYHRMGMMMAGRWVPHNPDHPNKRRRGYHLSALYSTLGYTWADAAIQWLAANTDLKKKTFFNTVLGLEWKEQLDSPDHEVLYARRESYAMDVPANDAAFITIGCDVQKDRIEYEVVAWSEGKVQQSLSYNVIDGATDQDEVWKRLDAVVNRVFVREDGAQMPVRLMAIDSGFNTNHVYNFCRKYDPSKVIPIKGSATVDTAIGYPRSVDIKPDGKVVGKVRVWSIGVDIIKTELYGWLRQIKKEDYTPIGYCRFPQYSEEYFKMLVAEKKAIVVDKRGFRKYAWTLPAHARNEALDCRVYNRAAASIVGMDRFSAEKWKELRDSHSGPTQDNKQAEKKGSPFLGGKSIW